MYIFMNIYRYVYIYIYVGTRVQALVAKWYLNERVRDIWMTEVQSRSRVLLLSVKVLLVKRTGTGWRRLIGSPKLQIIFHKRAIKYRLLLRKMTCKDKGSYESSPPSSAVPKQELSRTLSFKYHFVTNPLI